MKKTFLLLFICCCCNSLMAQSTEVYTEDKQCELEELSQTEQQSFLQKTKSSPGTVVPDNYDIGYERLQFFVNPHIDSIKGNITFYFTPVATGFDKIVFDCDDSLLVDSVKYHQQQLIYTYGHNDRLYIYFGNTLTAHQPDSLTIYYHGKPQKGNGFAAFVQSTHNGHGIIWTLSEPYGAKNWMLCKQSLNDKIDSIDIYITCPDSFNTAANGLLKSEVHHPDNTITAHWVHRYPIATYLIAIACTNYSVYYDYYVNAQGDSLPIMNCVYPEYETNFKEGTNRLLGTLKFYEEKFGAYPFYKEKYGHAQFGWGGGMEHQTHTFVNNWKFGLINHELAHQWFGDKVTCPQWKEIWLNEGFATYSSALADLYVANDTATWEAFKFRCVQDILLNGKSGSVYVYDTTDVRRVFSVTLTYFKGAMVLHQLRYLLGDSIFFRAIRNYLHDASTVYSFGSTRLLQHYFEQEAQITLQPYFDYWIYGNKTPYYDVTWIQKMDNTVVVEVKNTNALEASVPLKLNLVHWDAAGKHDSIFLLYPHSSTDVYYLHMPYEIQTIELNTGFDFIADGKVEKSLLAGYNEQQPNLFPNPAHDILYLLSRKGGNQNYVIRNMVGQEIKRESFYPQQLPARKYEQAIDISQLPKGMYIIYFGEYAGRFIKD